MLPFAPCGQAKDTKLPHSRVYYTSYVTFSHGFNLGVLEAIMIGVPTSTNILKVYLAK